MAEYIVEANTLDELVNGIYVIGGELIRCRDCEHHDGIRCFRWNSIIITGFDDFCSRWQRREDDDHTCETCRYNYLTWDMEPCDSCTMGGPSNHWEPKEDGDGTDE